MDNGKIQVILRTKLHGFCVFVTCIPGTDHNTPFLHFKYVFSLDYVLIKRLTKKTQVTRVNYGIEM